jgi:hypothetical protein
MEKITCCRIEKEQSIEGKRNGEIVNGSDVDVSLVETGNF